VNPIYSFSRNVKRERASSAFCEGSGDRAGRDEGLTGSGGPYRLDTPGELLDPQVGGGEHLDGVVVSG
jgi:hypothetical protein